MLAGVCSQVRVSRCVCWCVSWLAYILAGVYWQIRVLAGLCVLAGVCLDRCVYVGRFVFWQVCVGRCVC